MSNPRVKRQFAGAATDPAQRQITTFYCKTPSTASPNPIASAPLPSTTVAPPPPPPHIQADLLSVGMRIRKSVPDGYKTGSAYTCFNLWTDADVSGRSKSQAGRPRPTGSSAPVPAPAPAPLTNRELQPFCGIHKVGGLSVQPSNAGSSSSGGGGGGGVGGLGLSHMPGLCSSQDSSASADSISSVPEPALASRGPAGRKRRSDQDDEADDDDGTAFRPALLTARTWSGTREAWFDAEISPRSPAPAGFENARVLATPRPRKRASLSAVSGGFHSLPHDSAALATLGQENVVMTDFEEATFLDQRWVVQEGMDME